MGDATVPVPASLRPSRPLFVSQANEAHAGPTAPFPVEPARFKRFGRKTLVVVPHLNCRQPPDELALVGPRVQTGKRPLHDGFCSIAVDLGACGTQMQMRASAHESRHYLPSRTLSSLSAIPSGRSGCDAKPRASADFLRFRTLSAAVSPTPDRAVCSPIFWSNRRH